MTLIKFHENSLTSMPSRLDLLTLDYFFFILQEEFSCDFWYFTCSLHFETRKKYPLDNILVHSNKPTPWVFF